MPLLIAFQLLDTVTTWIGVVQLGGQEMHPYIAWLISRGRWDMVILGKLAWCGLFYLALKSFGGPRTWQKRATLGFAAGSAFASLWNTVGMLTVILEGDTMNDFERATMKTRVRDGQMWQLQKILGHDPNYL